MAFDEAGKNELFVLMITRLVPLFPYNLQNFAYGVTDIPFSTYSIFSLIFMLPGTAMYTIGISGLAGKGKQGTLYQYCGHTGGNSAWAWGCSSRKSLWCSQREWRMSRDRKVMIKDGDKCIHCHLCQKHCSFLTKYGADIGDTVKLRELAYPI